MKIKKSTLATLFIASMILANLPSPSFFAEKNVAHSWTELQ